jgi:tRNA A37 methylthiotransferase MiaB
MKPRVYLSIFEYACERRELDAKRILDFFEKNSYPIVQKPKQADVIIYISCGIIEKNTEASIGAIRELQKYKARLIVGGCATEIDSKRVRAVHGGEFFSTKNLDALDDLFPNEEYPFRDTDDANCRYTVLRKNIWNGTILRFIDAIPGAGKIFRAIVKARVAAIFGTYSFAYIKAVGLEKDYYIRIADGCASSCSYCALPAAIGRLKSKNASQCLKEFEQGLEKGYKNITITAEDTGAWGAEAADNAGPVPVTANIAGLLRQMISCGESRATGDYSIIISSLNPAGLYRYLEPLLEVFRSSGIRCVVVPVQSLNPRLLKLMHRFADINAIRESLCAIRKASPGLWISTHILVGFPSETTEELYETLSLWEELPFDEGQFFAFSLKPGTPAEKIEGRISDEEIRNRMKLAYRYFRRRGYACFFHDYDFLFVSKKHFKNIDKDHRWSYTVPKGDNYGY